MSINQVFNKSWSKNIKGFAIVLVLVGHLNIIPRAGAYGVALFLFVSGFGMSESFKVKDGEGFFKDKLINIYLPYLLVQLTTALTFIVSGINFTTEQFLNSVLLRNFGSSLDSTMWYVSFICILYLPYYILMKYIARNKKIGIQVSAILIWLFSLFINNWFNSGSGVFLYLIYLPAGMIFSSFSNSDISKWISKKMYINAIIISASFFLLLKSNFFDIGLNFKDYYKLEVFSFALFSILLFSFFSRVKLFSTAFEYFSKLSYIIYLVEGVIINNYSAIWKQSGIGFIDSLSFVVLTIVIATIMNAMIYPLTKRITSPSVSLQKKFT